MCDFLICDPLNMRRCAGAAGTCVRERRISLLHSSKGVLTPSAAVHTPAAVLGRRTVMYVKENTVPLSYMDTADNKAPRAEHVPAWGGGGIRSGVFSGVLSSRGCAQQSGSHHVCGGRSHTSDRADVWELGTAAAR